MRKLWRVAESAMLRIKEMLRGFDHRVHHAGIERSPSRVMQLSFGDSLRQRFGGAIHFRAARLECLSNAQQNAAKSRPPHGIVRRKIRAAKKRFSLRRKKSRQRPAALPRNRADCGLIACVHVGPLVSIYFHRDIVLVDHRCDFRILVALAVNHVAPVAPHRANVEQDRLLLRARFRKRFLAPFIPVNRLMSRRSKIRARGIFQAIFSSVRHIFRWRVSPANYWIGLLWSASRGSIGLRAAKPSSWR